MSDALHERLTKRFVDRRTSVLMRRLRENAMLEAEISVNGDVFVEGHHIGQLAGFREDWITALPISSFLKDCMELINTEEHVTNDAHNLSTIGGIA